MRSSSLGFFDYWVCIVPQCWTGLPLAKTATTDLCVEKNLKGMYIKRGRSLIRVPSGPQARGGRSGHLAKKSWVGWTHSGGSGRGRGRGLRGRGIGKRLTVHARRGRTDTAGAHSQAASGFENDGEAEEKGTPGGTAGKGLLGSSSSGEGKTLTLQEMDDAANRVVLAQTGKESLGYRFLDVGFADCDGEAVNLRENNDDEDEEGGEESEGVDTSGSKKVEDNEEELEVTSSVKKSESDEEALVNDCCGALTPERSEKSAGSTSSSGGTNNGDAANTVDVQNQLPEETGMLVRTPDNASKPDEPGEDDSWRNLEPVVLVGPILTTPSMIKSKENYITRTETFTGDEICQSNGVVCPVGLMTTVEDPECSDSGQDDSENDDGVENGCITASVEQLIIPVPTSMDCQEDTIDAQKVQPAVANPPTNYTYKRVRSNTLIRYPEYGRNGLNGHKLDNKTGRKRKISDVDKALGRSKLLGTEDLRLPTFAGNGSSLACLKQNQVHDDIQENDCEGRHSGMLDGMFTNGRQLRRKLNAGQHRSSGAWKSREFCPQYHRFGSCVGAQMGICRYKHDPKKISVCPGWLQGKCKNPRCKLQHAHRPELMPVCVHFWKGVCWHDPCPYLHVKVDPEAPICPAFLNGYCPLEDKCRNKHFTQKMVEELEKDRHTREGGSSAWSNFIATEDPTEETMEAQPVA